MLEFRVEFTKSAKKEFKDLPKNIQQKVIDCVTLLSKNPKTELLQIKKLKGVENLYRVRLGNYRLVYTINSNVLSVLVIKIGHRKEVYR